MAGSRAPLTFRSARSLSVKVRHTWGSALKSPEKLRGAESLSQLTLTDLSCQFNADLPTESS